MYFFLEDTKLWDVTGADCRKFLNNILTQNIQRLTPGEGAYTLMCSRQGKIQADLFCYAFNDFFRIQYSKNLNVKIQNYLRSCVIIDDIQFREEIQASGLFISFDDAACLELKDLPKNSLNHGNCDSLWIIRKPTWGIDGIEIWGQEAELQSMAQKIQDNRAIAPLDHHSQEILRIESKASRFGIDFDEGTLPQEANLYEALSFDKGCYVGQEIIARVEHRGHVNQKLVLLKFENEIPLEQGEKIYAQNGDEVGHVTSFCVSPKYDALIAFGYVKMQTMNSKLRLYAKNTECRIIM